MTLWMMVLCDGKDGIFRAQQVFMWINPLLLRILQENLFLIMELIKDGPQGVSNSPRSTWARLWQGPHNMDILEWKILWYTLGAKYSKGNYYIFIFISSIVCVIPMAF